MAMDCLAIDIQNRRRVHSVSFNIRGICQVKHMITMTDEPFGQLLEDNNIDDVDPFLIQYDATYFRYFDRVWVWNITFKTDEGFAQFMLTYGVYVN